MPVTNKKSHAKCGNPFKVMYNILFGDLYFDYYWRSGHLEPDDISSDFKNTYKCTSCGSIGSIMEITEHYPCPKCGGDVERNGPARWVRVDGIWQWMGRNITYIEAKT